MELHLISERPCCCRAILYWIYVWRLYTIIQSALTVCVKKYILRQMSEMTYFSTLHAWHLMKELWHTVWSSGPETVHISCLIISFTGGFSYRISTKAVRNVGITPISKVCTNFYEIHDSTLVLSGGTGVQIERKFVPPPPKKKEEKKKFLGYKLIYILSKVRRRLQWCARNSWFLTGFTWRCNAPNLPRIGQELWYLWVQIHLSAKVKYLCGCINFHVTRSTSLECSGDVLYRISP